MKKNPSEKQNTKTIPKKININELMSVFDDDIDNSQHIKKRIKEGTEEMDKNLLTFAKEYVQKKEWYNAKYILQKMITDKTDEVKILLNEIENTIADDEKSMEQKFNSSHLINKANNIQAYPAYNLWIYIQNISINTWAGMEYGKDIVVVHNGVVHKKYFKRRDGFSAKEGHREYNFNDIKHVKIEQLGSDIQITITLKSDTGEYSTIFTIPEQENKTAPILSPEEQETFEKTFENAKESIAKLHFRTNGRMPMYINFIFWPSMPGMPWMDQMIPYEQPEIYDTYIDTESWTGIIIIKAQIDHDVVDGKQYERVGYKINNEWIKNQIFRETRYQSQIMKWAIITTRAENLL